ncbi:MAG: DUF2911 domain-containing protein [Planctomycetota bacterium]
MAIASSLFAALAGAAAVLVATAAPTPRPLPLPLPLPHPHFPKRLECRVAEDVTVTVQYQTVTFRKEAAAAMQPGQAWHLAGAAFSTTADLEIGGRAVAAGDYSLKVRKTADDGWELILDTDGRFSRDVTDAALVLATEVRPGERFEHLCIDLQPTGDKDHTTLHLDVRFDALHATALVRVPGAPKEDAAKDDDGK